MSNPRQALMHFLHRFGVVGPAYSRASQGVSAPKTSRRLFLSALVAALAALSFATPALAKEVHAYSFSFGSEGSGAGQLKEPNGVAVNSATGDVYVADQGNNRIDEFDSNGTFIRAWGWGVGTGLGGFEECTEVLGCKAGTVGTGPGQLDSPETIAVDNSGSASDPSKEDVYVADPSNGVVDKFSSTGKYLYKITEAAGKLLGNGNQRCAKNSEPGVLCGVAVSPNGELWIGVSQDGIFNFSDTPENKYIAERYSAFMPNAALAVDSAENIYVAHSGGQVIKLSSTGTVLANEFYEGSAGIVVDPSEKDNLFIEHPGKSKNEEVVSEVSAADSTLETFGAGHLDNDVTAVSYEAVGRGLAVNSSTGTVASGTVYAADATGDYIAVFPKIAVPTVTAEPVSSSTATSATLEGTVNPEGTPITGCEFEYGTEPGVFPEKASCAPEVSVAKPLTGTAPISLSATATGLTQGDTYYYRLSVLAAGETYSSSELPYFLPHTATIANESAPFVEPTRAWLEAEINPGGTEVPYHFEYGPAAGSYDVSVPVPDAYTSPSLIGVRVGELAKGLTPGTTYHFRLVASPLSGEVDGPDQTFTTPALPSAPPETCPNAKLRAEQPYGQALPDCRAYEMVSPLDKDDSNILFDNSRASVSGEALTYLSPGSFAGPQGEGPESRYIARREPGQDRWSTENISPPINAEHTSLLTPFEQMLFTPSLSEGLVTSVYVPLAGEPAGYYNLDLANFETTPTSYRWVSNVTPPNTDPFEEFLTSEPEAAGASTDLSHVVFQTTTDLTEGATGPGEHVYEWAAGKLSQVDVPPAGTEFKDSDDVGQSGDFNQAAGADTWHAVSANGLRVFFTAGEIGGHNLGQLYVRENPEQPQSPEVNGKCTVSADACTVEASASQRTNSKDELEPDPNGVKQARYWGASSDGSKVFFTSRSELTSEAKTGPADNAPNLYEYNVETGVLSDLTVDTEAGDGAAVLGLVTAGDEGSYVYFVAEGKLAEGSTSGQPNLYLSHSGEVTFIATLAPATRQEGETSPEEGGDSPDWSGNRESDSNGIFQGPGSHTVRVTPDGTTLAFESERSPTGYDTEHSEPGQCEEEIQEGVYETGKCRELYVYNATAGATTGKLVCASCNPSGVRPVGPAKLGGDESGGLERLAIRYLPRNLSEDGKRLFFQSGDALAPHDGNGKLDVYEWEAEGEGSCTQAGGCVFPISDVSGNNPSYFMDASPSGDDVFIATADQLLPSDTDTRVDVYDVKVEGGFPVTAPSPVCDNGDSCKPPASPQPAIFGTPSSATFSGPGNPPSPPPPAVIKPKTAKKTIKCKKGLVKNKTGKCVKRSKKKSKAKKAKRVSRDLRTKS
jgi:hypothetical protein